MDFTASLKTSPPAIVMKCCPSSMVFADAGCFAPPPATMRSSPFEPSLWSTADSMPTDAFEASMTTAPAPSAKSTHVERSFQFRNRDSVSAPMTRAFWWVPDTIMPRATAIPDTKPVQAASMSNAPARSAPSASWTMQAVAGKM